MQSFITRDNQSGQDTQPVYRVSFGGGGGGGRGGDKGGHLPPPPLDPECPPLDFDFILSHSLVVDAAPPYISNTLVCPP